MERLDFEPKLVAFDLDGTLAESKQPLEPAMGQLLAGLMAKIPIAVMSGGSFAQFQKQFFSGLPADIPDDRLYIFPTNAGQCFVLKRGEWQQIYSNSFSEEEKKKILDALAAAMLESGFAKEPAQVWGPRIEDRGAQITFSALGQLAPPDIKAAWDPNREKRRPLWIRLQELLPEFTIGLNATTSIDIVRKGVNKAFGVREASRITGIAISDMLYVGDALWEGGNDAVVKETGVRTVQVQGPVETTDIITRIISS